MNSLLLFFTAIWAAAVLNQSESDRIMASIDSMTATISHISFQYQYSKTVSLLQEEITAAGQVDIDMSSSILKWTKESPSHSEIIFAQGDAQGSSITKDNKQIYRKISKFINSRLNSRTIDGQKEFNRSVSCRSTGYVVHLVPKSEEAFPFFTRIELTFDKTSFLVKEIRMEDSDADVTVISISSIKTGR